MRSVILTAAVFSLATGVSFTKVENQQPSELGAAQNPPIQSEPAAPPLTTAQPSLPDATPVLTEEQAKSKIESQGYTEVSGLKKDDKGMWTATAMKEGKPVQLSLDTQGQIILMN